MGRALWLNGKQGEAVVELQRSIELSPNFALGHYTPVSCTAKVVTALGHRRDDYARELSPFDPLQFAMLARPSVAHVSAWRARRGRDWAVKATGRPNAHAHILAIAAQCLALTHRRDEASKFVAGSAIACRRTTGRLLARVSLRQHTEKLFRRSARQINFDSTP